MIVFCHVLVLTFVVALALVFAVSALVLCLLIVCCIACFVLFLLFCVLAAACCGWGWEELCIADVVFAAFAGLDLALVLDALVLALGLLCWLFHVCLFDVFVCALSLL